MFKLLFVAACATAAVLPDWDLLGGSVDYDAPKEVLTFSNDYEKIAGVNGSLSLEHSVVSKSVGGQTLKGHVFWANPINAFHIYTSTDGCPGRDEVSVNSKARGCYVATNLGFFNMSTGECRGHVVSNGKLIQSATNSKSSFGVRKDGTLIAGYVNKTLAKDGNWLHLAQGRGWLVRNGKSYISTAASKESISDSFVSLHAPRLAVGFDTKGRIGICAIEGKESTSYGPPLGDFATLLISLGFQNAINFDGGGSVTLVWNKQICMASGLNNLECKTAVSAAQEEPPVNVYERPVTTISCLMK